MIIKAEKRPLACIILAAGKGTRMKTSLPKVLHQVAGVPMLFHVLDAARALNPQKIVTILAPDMRDLEVLLRQQRFGSDIAYQKEQLGTGHAVQSAKSALKGFDGDVLILYGDSPLIHIETLQAMLTELRKPGIGMTVLGMHCEDPGSYGRLVLNKKKTLDAIVEASDATKPQLKIKLCNAGLMAVPSSTLFDGLEKLNNKNAQKEYYLTDIVGLLRKQKKTCAVVTASEAECQGVNTRAQLAAVNLGMQQRLRARVMAEGATLIDPDSVHLCTDTKFGQDVVVFPQVYFGPGVTIADNVEIRSFCNIEGARIASNCVIGPFARLRPGTNLGEGVHIGNFVEVKQSSFDRGAKANHLSYIGDSFVGEKANIGAGTITCNYDGYQKHRTDIGPGAFIGSNSSLVAPVVIGAGAIVGAGSVITEDVEAHALALSRAPQKQKPGWAQIFRNRKNN